MRDRDGWEVAENGNPIARKLKTAECGKHAGSIVLRLQWLVDGLPGLAPQSVSKIQVHMPPQAAHDLGQELVRLSGMKPIVPKGRA
jgi:hypothetical protein